MTTALIIMDPFKFGGSRVKLSDLLLEEMKAFSDDRETRRAAVRKILVDRGLGDVAKALSPTAKVRNYGDREELIRRKNSMLEKLKLINDSPYVYFDTLPGSSSSVKDTSREKGICETDSDKEVIKHLTSSSTPLLTNTLSVNAISKVKFRPLLNEDRLSRKESSTENLADEKHLSTTLKDFTNLKSSKTDCSSFLSGHLGPQDSDPEKELTLPSTYSEFLKTYFASTSMQLLPNQVVCKGGTSIDTPPTPPPADNTAIDTLSMQLPQPSPKSVECECGIIYNTDTTQAEIFSDTPPAPLPADMTWEHGMIPNITVTPPTPPLKLEYRTIPDIIITPPTPPPPPPTGTEWEYGTLPAVTVTPFTPPAGTEWEYGALPDITVTTPPPTPAGTEWEYETLTVTPPTPPPTPPPGIEWEYRTVPDITITPPTPPSRPAEWEYRTVPTVTVTPPTPSSRPAGIEWEYGTVPDITTTPPTPPSRPVGTEWKCRTVPDIIITSPTPPAGENNNSPVEIDAVPFNLEEVKLEDISADFVTPPSSVAKFLESASGSSGNPEISDPDISKAYYTYLKVISTADPVTKSALTANKWEAISYLSGIPVERFHTEIPEWYTALHSMSSAGNVGKEEYVETVQRSTLTLPLSDVNREEFKWDTSPRV